MEYILIFYLPGKFGLFFDKKAWVAFLEVGGAKAFSKGRNFSIKTVLTFLRNLHSQH